MGGVDVTATEEAPGVHRLAWAIGTKPMASYLLAPDDSNPNSGLILVDTGLPDTPEAVYLPAIRALGRRPEEVRLVVITHADADHIGGNAACRRVFPNALLACHAADRRWVDDPDVLMAERYDAFVPYGLRYDPEVFDLLGGWMGPPEPVDLELGDGVGLRLGSDWLTVRHVPGHSPGHILLHNPTRRWVVVGDALFGESQLDTFGHRAAAPPYTDVEAYRSTVRTVAALGVDLLFTCHYPVMRGPEVATFAAASLAWSECAEAVTRRLLGEADRALTLGEAIDRADPLLGPFEAPRELQWALLAHLDHVVGRGEARRTDVDGIVGWEGIGR